VTKLLERDGADDDVLDVSRHVDVYGASVALLVTRAKAEEQLVVEQGVRGQPMGADGSYDPLGCLVGTPAHGLGRPCHAAHAYGDAGTVAEREVTGGFHGMADGVAEKLSV